MEYTLKGETLKPSLHCKSGVITEADIEFINFTGYSKEEIVGKSLIELSSMLRIDSQIEVQNIKGNRKAYIFTKAFEPRDVIIYSVFAGSCDEKTLCFHEKPNSRIKDKFGFFGQNHEINKVGIAVYSFPDKILLEANQKYLDSWDPPYNRREISLGKKHEEIVTGYETNSLEEIWRNIVKTGVPFYSEEAEFEHFKRGTTYWQCSMIPICFEGEEKYIIETSTEVTDKVLKRRFLQEQVKSKKQMEKKLKMQEELFANVSHELKTPLNVIFSTAQLFELYIKNNSLISNTHKISRNVHTIRQNCYRLTKLIGNIVDLSKIKSGFLQLNLSNQNIVEVAEDIVQSVSEYVEEKDFNIIFDTDIEEKIIACDPEKIERILLNLISNAIKFSEVGGDIFVTVADKGEYVEISVKDKGIGMDENHLDAIFQRFHKEEDSLTINAEGSGIGLSLLKSIVEMHDGKISAESRLEKINIEFSDIYS
jgi:signal transduction histidine kinase